MFNVHTGTLSEILFWLLFSAVAMSFIEHQVHQRIMHQQTLIVRFISALEKVFKHHAVMHHTSYRESFQQAPLAHGADRGIRLSLIEGFLEGLPIAIVIAVFSRLGALTFLCVVLLHHLIWNAIHLEMHHPRKRFFSSWPLYKSLARHHFLHHKYNGKNFNVVFPIADYVLCTVAQPSQSDYDLMRRNDLY